MVVSTSTAYGFIVRNTSDFRNSSTLKLLYDAYVRAKLEYVSLVWYPRHQLYIDLLESVKIS
nr:unnamed protein product [Callosobruchus chinensis]